MSKMKAHFERIRQWDRDREEDEKRDAEYWESLYLKGLHPDQKKKENQPPAKGHKTKAK